jgi:nitroreductase
MMYGPETTDLAQMYYEVFKHKQEAGELEGSIFYNAPALILAHDIGKNSIGPTNCAIAIRNIEILALTMGLGTCWCGFLTGAANRKPRKINKLIKLDSSRRIWGALMIGYPRYKSKKKIPRVEREVAYF